MNFRVRVKVRNNVVSFYVQVVATMRNVRAGRRRGNDQQRSPAGLRRENRDLLIGQ